MTRRWTAALWASVAGCGGASAAGQDAGAPVCMEAPARRCVNRTADATQGPRVRKVMIIGLDGTRPDAVVAADAPVLDDLMARGASSLRARTQMSAVTVSAPGWTSILTGVEATRHRVIDNDSFEARDTSIPSLFKILQGAGRRTAEVDSWIPMHSQFLEREGAVTKADYWPDDKGCAEKMAAMLSGPAESQVEADLYFLYLQAVDSAGHATKFLPTEPKYLAAIEMNDRLIGETLDAIGRRPMVAREDWLVIVTTDHGGDENGHGALNEANRTIFLILWGPGGFTVNGAAAMIPVALGTPSHMDTTPLSLAHLGVPLPAGIDGSTRGLAW